MVGHRSGSRRRRPTPTSTSSRSVRARSSSRAAPRTVHHLRAQRRLVEQGRQVHLDAIEFVIQTDPARRADQLIGGELDVMHTSDPETIQQLRDEPGLNTFEDDRGEEGFVMINSQAPPFDDIRVAQGADAGDSEAGLSGAHRPGRPQVGREHVQLGAAVLQPRRQAGGRRRRGRQGARRGVLRREAAPCARAARSR